MTEFANEYNYTQLAKSIFCPIIKLGFISTSINLNLTDRTFLFKKIRQKIDEPFQPNALRSE